MNRRSRRAALGAATTVLLLAGGFVFLRGGSTPVSPESAVARFREKNQISIEDERRESRAEVGSPTGAPSKRVQAHVTTEVVSGEGLRPLPREGVYVYETTGGDEVDVLGGSRHTYPAETTITVGHAGCGIVERWDALEERWDERESCQTSGGETLKRMTSFHEFFGHGDKRTLHCLGYTYPAGFDPGMSWSVRCNSENTTAETRLTAVGWEDLDVGGTRVRTMHVRGVTKLSGEQVGTSVRDVWGSSDSGIIVRERTELTSDSNQPVFGRTRYNESYELRLKSLEPRR